MYLIIEKIRCTGKDGIERLFYLCSSQREFINNEWFFKVKTNPENLYEEFFELTLQIISDDTARIVGIYTNDEQKYGQKGIPDVLVPMICKITGKIICSSSNKNSQSGNEYRTLDATKMWNRFVSKKIAFYDQDKDTYFLKT